jgi:hypothetical protein
MQLHRELVSALKINQARYFSEMRFLRIANANVLPMSIHRITAIGYLQYANLVR